MALPPPPTKEPGLPAWGAAASFLNAYFSLFILF